MWILLQSPGITVIRLRTSSIVSWLWDFFFENLFTKSMKKNRNFLKTSHARGPERWRSNTYLNLKVGFPRNSLILFILWSVTPCIDWLVGSKLSFPVGFSRNNLLLSMFWLVTPSKDTYGKFVYRNLRFDRGLTTEERTEFLMAKLYYTVLRTLF